MFCKFRPLRGGRAVGAALPLLVTLLCAGGAKAQMDGSYKDPLWWRTAERHWYNEEVVAGQPAPSLLFGLDDRKGVGTYGTSTLFEMQRMFSTPPGDDDVELKAFQRKALLALPLLHSGNALQLLFRPEGDLYNTYVKRLALGRLRRAAPAAVPEGGVAVDLHVHTCYSHDSLADPAEMLLAAARRGLSGVAITDHNTTEGGVKALDALARLKREGRVPPSFFVIPGEEVSSTEGHIIALFIHQEIPSGMGAARTIQVIHAQGGLAVAAHPELADGVGSLANTLAFDAVETKNAAEEMDVALGRAPKKDRAAFFATVSKPRIGSSDAHDPSVVAACYTVLADCPPTPEGVRAALLAGRAEPVSQVGNAARRGGALMALPRLAFAVGSLFGSDSSGIGAWLKARTHADAARVTVLPHPWLQWEKRY